jgi:outer membrane protein assembly factor BamB
MGKALRKYGLICFICLVSIQVLDAQNWSFREIKHYQADAAFFGSPQVTEKTVLIGNHDKHVYFFSHDGELLNAYKTGGWIHATPSQLKNGQIAIGSYDRFLYFFTPDGKFLDKLRIGGRIFTNIVENIDEKLIFGCNNSLVSLDFDTKEFIKINTWNLLHGSIELLSNGELAIGSNAGKMFFISSIGDIVRQYTVDGWIVHSKPVELSTGYLVFGSYDKHLHFTKLNGVPVGKINLGGKIHGTPIENPDGNIVVGSFDGSLYFISPRGKVIHRFDTGNKIVASPVSMTGGNVLVASYDDHLYLVSPEGQELARYDTGGNVFSSPKKINDSTVVVANTKGKISFLRLTKREDTVEVD